MKHGTITRQEMLWLVEALGGEAGVDAVLAGRNFKPVKYGELTAGQEEAFFNNVGGVENILANLRGELEIVFKQPEIILSFNAKTGICLASKGLQHAVTQPNPNFSAEKLQRFDYGTTLTQYEKDYGPSGMTVSDFQKAVKFQIAELNKQPKGISNIQTGPFFPIITPAFPQKFDWGVWVEAAVENAGAAYKEIFSGRDFNNYQKNNLANQVSLVEGCRWLDLLTEINSAKTPRVGLYFPQALHSWSVLAAREVERFLPQGFFLSGPDCIIGMNLYPQYLAKNWNTPGYDLSAFQFKGPALSLYFQAIDVLLDFVSGSDLGSANDHYASSLFWSVSKN